MTKLEIKNTIIQARKEEPKHKSQLTYDRFIVYLEVKPNLFMRLFLKSLGIKVKILNEGGK